MQLKPRELAAVLFALRHLQANLDDETQEMMATSDHFAGLEETINEDEIDKLCERLNTGINCASLLDMADPNQPEVRISLTNDSGQLFIGIPGYGEQAAAEGHGTPIGVEIYEGRLRVLAWDNINNGDPRIIDMEGAREDQRIE